MNASRDERPKKQRARADGPASPFDGARRAECDSFGFARPLRENAHENLPLGVSGRFDADDGAAKRIDLRAVFGRVALRSKSPTYHGDSLTTDAATSGRRRAWLIGDRCARATVGLTTASAFGVAERQRRPSDNCLVNNSRLEHRIFGGGRCPHTRRRIIVAAAAAAAAAQTRRRQERSFYTASVWVAGGVICARRRTKTVCRGFTPASPRYNFWRPLYDAPKTPSRGSGGCILSPYHEDICLRTERRFPVDCSFVKGAVGRRTNVDRQRAENPDALVQ
jgi:hypothetical protein